MERAEDPVVSVFQYLREDYAGTTLTKRYTDV
jgi:hypothetical protein